MNDDLKLDVWSHNETFKPRRKVVLLGASNLSRAFPIAISMSRSAFDTPLAFYVVKGHGRSYGKVSCCFGKKISGIFSCGIWRDLDREKNVPISAFLTDIGNDLAYEVPVDQILEWVEGCVDRLTALGARVVLSDLPMDALRQVSELRYRMFRTLFFPQCRLGWPEMLRRAEQLSERVRGLAELRKMPFFTVKKEWYGLDPIHPRRREFPEIWARLWSLVVDAPSDPRARRCPLGLAWYLRDLRPESWSTWTVQRRAIQPNGLLHDGSTISLY